ncbi:nitroreductase family protein [Aerosticca soli]|uniref:Putative NAD(P)H nitroreductase n=1 Tax=Aerosticca soli TaxID=2010829 RepID=A0A2Z6E3E4_9GAMM|nr:nitroreductase [Aerosticca soli]MDI3261961.1 nitroreductase [Fulvimonas sp.]BBD79576.1 oxygen-insensitive NADPH nitroreductase [Aerosticca soli]
MPLPAAFELLRQRRSVPARQLTAPAPEGDERRALLEAAVRVPDHGKRVPFRLIVLEGAAKTEFGERLARIAAARDPDASVARQAKERERYAHAPLVLVVVARIEPDGKIPESEQLLSAGCVAYNLLLGAEALGYGAQWLTGWAAYDAEVAALLGLAANERIIGFVHIGTPRASAPERARPALERVVTGWTPPH